MPNTPCEAPAAWVVTTGVHGSHQFACDRHRDAVLAKVSTAHRVLPLAEWLATQSSGPPGRQAE